MVRYALVPIAVLLAGALAGCGGDGGADSPADAVRVYNRAIADGDGARACMQLDDQAQRELQGSVQGSARGSCKQVIELLSAFYDEATKDKLKEVEVKTIPEGDRATVNFNAPSGFGGADRPQAYELRKVGDEWKIASLGISLDPGASGP